MLLLTLTLALKDRSVMLPSAIRRMPSRGLPCRFCKEVLDFEWAQALVFAQLDDVHNGLLGGRSRD